MEQGPHKTSAEDALQKRARGLNPTDSPLGDPVGILEEEMTLGGVGTVLQQIRDL